jgi:urea transport system permease protein
VLPSLEVVIWVAVGGRGTLIGAVLGAVAVNYGRSVLTNYFPEAWPFILGGLFVVVVTLFPDGLVGILRKLFARKDEAPAPGPTETGPAAPSPTAPRPGGAVT